VTFVDEASPDKARHLQLVLNDQKPHVSRSVYES